MNEPKKRVRVPALKEKKLRGEKITVLTAYDCTMAGLMDSAGIDVLLVGDSLGMVVLGHEDTLSVTLDTFSVTRWTWAKPFATPVDSFRAGPQRLRLKGEAASSMWPAGSLPSVFP
jgi:hypothetical protein